MCEHATTIENLPIFKEIFDKVVNPLVIAADSVDSTWKANVIGFTFAKKSCMKLQFIFWTDDLRLTVLIEAREVLDDYLCDESAPNTVGFLLCVLSNPIEKYVTYAGNKVRKIKYIYYVAKGDKVEDEQAFSLNWFKKSHIVKESFIAWLK